MYPFLRGVQIPLGIPNEDVERICTQLKDRLEWRQESRVKNIMDNSRIIFFFFFIMDNSRMFCSVFFFCNYD